MLRLSSLTLSLALAVVCLPGAAAGTVFVNANLTTGANDGSSWASAFQGPLGLQSALAVAVSGDQVFVAQGTYKPTATTSRTDSFQLINGVDILGGFLGTEATPAERPPFGSAPTILSGDLAGNGSGAGAFTDNSFHIIRTVGNNATAVLEGFTITGGAATTGGSNNDRGGGILCLGNVSPTIRHCRFIQNRSTFGGGAGYINNGGAPSFTDCSFEDGIGGSFGGAFDIASGAAVRFERCLFRGNTAARAGALEIFASTGPIVSNCVFIDNTATGSSGGGALWLGSGGNARIRSCTIVGNHSTTNNVAGIQISSAAAVTVRNCVVWGNIGPASATEQQAQIATNANAAHCLIAGGVFPGAGNVTGDPQFVNLVGADFALAAGSPCIDAGDNTQSIAGVVVDFAGDDRFVDVASVVDTGVGPAPVIDMGAFERMADGPFVDLGQALAGAMGAPVLTLGGTLVGGTPLMVSITNAAPLTNAFIIAGLSAVNLPFFGGVLVPSPDILVGLPTGAGSIVFAVNWPVGLPTGTQVFIQTWIQDPSGPLGVTATNAIVATTP